MPRDSWKLQNEYDEEAIYIGASDENGHSWKGRINLPKPWPGWIEAIVQSPDFPEYKTTSDFIRDSVFHRLHFWSDHPVRRTDTALRSRLALERAQSHLNASRDFSSSVAAFRVNLDEACAELHRSRDYDGLQRMLSDIEEEILTHFTEPYASDLMERVLYWRKHTA